MDSSVVPSSATKGSAPTEIKSQLSTMDENQTKQNLAEQPMPSPPPEEVKKLQQFQEISNAKPPGYEGIYMKNLSDNLMSEVMVPEDPGNSRMSRAHSVMEGRVYQEESNVVGGGGTDEQGPPLSVGTSQEPGLQTTTVEVSCDQY